MCLRMLGVDSSELHPENLRARPDLLLGVPHLRQLESAGSVPSVAVAQEVGFGLARERVGVGAETG